MTEREGPPPVLVVGAGLSAADAILMARSKGLPVVHAFRSVHQTQLPAVMYPEYHEVCWGVLSLKIGNMEVKN